MDQDQLNYHNRIKERIKKLQKHGRKYASFFDWFKREKNVREIGITRIFLTELQEQGVPSYQNLFCPIDDPPDVVAVSSEGNFIGIEVT